MDGEAPVIGKNKKLVDLPVAEAWAVVRINTTIGDIEHQIMERIAHNVPQHVTLDMFFEMETKIVQWNVKDDNGNLKPITPETIRELDSDDAVKIINAMRGIEEQPAVDLSTEGGEPVDDPNNLSSSSDGSEESLEVTSPSSGLSPESVKNSD